MSQDPIQQIQVSLFKTRKGGAGSGGPAVRLKHRILWALLARSQESGGQHRNQTQGHCQRTNQGKDDDIRQLLKEDAGNAAHENQGQKNNQRGYGAGDDGRADLPGPFH